MLERLLNNLAHCPLPIAPGFAHTRAHEIPHCCHLLHPAALMRRQWCRPSVLLRVFAFIPFRLVLSPRCAITPSRCRWSRSVVHRHIGARVCGAQDVKRRTPFRRPWRLRLPPLLRDGVSMPSLVGHGPHAMAWGAFSDLSRIPLRLEALVGHRSASGELLVDDGLRRMSLLCNRLGLSVSSLSCFALGFLAGAAQG